MALLHALRELHEEFGYRLAAAHLNHSLRGEESDRDESFCRELCERLGIDLIAERTAVLDPAMPNLEEEARDVRHEFLNKTAERIGAEYIATGHHADDQAETVLMRLLRGAGVAGLAAMAPTGPGRIIRPMLSLTRDDVMSYLESVGAKFVIDSSNLSSTILRNRIRRELLPMLDRDYAPGVSQRFAALAYEMREVDAFLSREAAREFSTMAAAGGGLNLLRFADLDPALRVPVLRLYLATEVGSLRRINRDQLEGLVNLCIAGPVNGEISLSAGYRAVREYSRLRILRRRRVDRLEFAVPLAFEGITEVPEAETTFEATVAGIGDVPMPTDHWSAVFDVRVVAAAGLTVRNFRSGDRIHPLGLAGTRKVKEVFIDRKVPPAKRARFPIVSMGNEIVWLPGLLRSNGALAGTSSEAVLLVKARQAEA